MQLNLYFCTIFRFYSKSDLEGFAVKIIRVVDVCSSPLPIFGGVRNHKSVGPIALLQDRTRLKSGKDYGKEIKIQVSM